MLKKGNLKEHQRNYINSVSYNGNCDANSSSSNNSGSNKWKLI